MRPLRIIIREKVLRFEEKIINSNKGVAKICLQGHVHGHRSRGRPKRRWHDNIKEWRGSNNTGTTIAITK